VIYINALITIINEWDPADLLFHAPDDEYLFEIEKIKDFLMSTRNHCELTLKIQNIFKKSRGNNFLKNSQIECAEVAQKILQLPIA